MDWDLALSSSYHRMAWNGLKWNQKCYTIKKNAKRCQKGTKQFFFKELKVRGEKRKCQKVPKSFKKISKSGKKGKKKNFQSGFKWLKIAPNCSKWIQIDLNGSKWLQMAWNGFSSALKVLHYSKKEMPKGAKKVPISFLFCFKELDVREKMPTKRF